MRSLLPLIAPLLMFLGSAAAGAAETWLLALGEREEDPQWGVVQLLPPPNWEELKEGPGGITPYGFLNEHVTAMFRKVRVTLTPFMVDLMNADNSAMEFFLPPRKFTDVLEILLSEFDIADNSPRMLATVQVLLSAAPFGSPSPSSNIPDVECVRLALIKGGRKRAFVKLTQTLRVRSKDRTGEDLPEAPGEETSDEALAAYWRSTLLKDFAGQIETVSCNAARGLMIFEIRNGAAEEFKMKLSDLSASF